MSIHQWRVIPEHFERIADGTRPFHVTIHEREVAAGDVVHIVEWDPKRLPSQRLTGSECWAVIACVERGGRFGVDAGHTVFGLENVTRLREKALVYASKQEQRAAVSAIAVADDIDAPAVDALLAGARVKAWAEFDAVCGAVAP
jgi:hypothetical protein